MTPPPQEAPQYGSASTAPLAAAAAPAAVNVPEGFDSEGFLRVAKLNFVRLQAANDARNLDDLREFVTPEIYAEIKLEMNDRGTAQQQTDVVTLNAEMLEVVTEGHQHIASVRFNGMIREAANAAATPFEEVWHLSKPVDGSRGWAVAGIQQIA
jgi:predicted lipid-binding transport protein (Tim44 family)